MIVDIFVTTKNRPDLLHKSLVSLEESVPRSLYRLTVVQDGDYSVTTNVLNRHPNLIDHRLVHKENMGLGPSINQALAHIDAVDRYFEHPTHGDPEQVAPFICYCQDDLLYTKDWLPRLIQLFTVNEKTYKLGFASGVECVEHPVKQEIAPGIVLKDWIRAAQMFGRREYWMSMWPIPRFDMETGRVRAKPDNGMGSGVDWHFIRDHENSVCKQGRTCLVIPGLVSHMGYRNSTWLNRELPESESDKKRVEVVLSEMW